MTSEEKFVFDLQGYIIIKNVLTKEEIEEINQISDRIFPRDYNKNGNNQAGLELRRTANVSKWDPACQRLIDHPKVTPYLKELLGPTFRLDHDYCIFMSRGGEPGGNLHGGPETANISIDSKGTVTLFIGTQSNGQGHATAYSQIISEQLKIPLNNIKVIQGDTTLIKSGGGTGGSRSIPVGGVATSEASKLILEKAKGIASKMFDVPISEIHLADDGFYTVQGTNKSADLQYIYKAK